MPVGCRRPNQTSIKSFILLVLSPRAPSMAERRGTPSGVLASFDQSANPFRSATIILMFGRTPNKKELALHIHHFLALNAKSYNDTA